MKTMEDRISKARQDFRDFLDGKKSMEQLKRDLDHPGTRDPKFNNPTPLEDADGARWIDVWDDIQVALMLGRISQLQEAELFAVIEGSATPPTTPR